MHEADRLVGAAAAGAGDAGDGDDEIGVGFAERAARHRLGGLAAHRAVFLDGRSRHAEHLLLGLVRIGDEAAIDHVRGAGDVGERAGDQAAGAGFRRRDFQPRARQSRARLWRRRASQLVAHHAALQGRRTVAVA